MATQYRNSLPYRNGLVTYRGATLALTVANDGTSMTDVSGSWSNNANAYDDNKLTYAATVSAVGTHVVDITGYNFASSIEPSATLVQVRVNVSQYVSDAAKFNAPTVQAFSGGSAIGSPATLTERAAAGDEYVTLTVTLAQLRSADFKIRYSVQQTSI